MRPGSILSGENAAKKQWHETLAERARVGRRLQHDELSGLEHLGQGDPARDERPEVRLAVPCQRRGDGHDHGLRMRELRVAGGGMEAVGHAGERLVGHVLDV